MDKGSWLGQRDRQAWLWELHLELPTEGIRA